MQNCRQLRLDTMRIALFLGWLILDTQGEDLLKQIESTGYPIEEHEVVTADGYILKMHRIKHRRISRVWHYDAERQPGVLLMHGMMGTSASFVTQGLKSNLAYNMAEAGCDVWMGNARGNIYSRQHTTLNLNDNDQKFKFFDFGWEEIALYDIPAMVNHMLNVTGAHRVSFVGDGLGGTAFLILNSLKPEYNDKFEIAQLLDPIGYMRHFPSTELKFVAAEVQLLYDMAQELGLVEISSLALKNIPPGGIPKSHLALQTIVSIVASIGGFSQVGTSLKVLVHYGQNIRDRSFKRWDYGQKDNLIIYGKPFSPAYNLSLITVYTRMYFCQGERFVSKEDLLAMASAMPDADVDDMNITDYISFQGITDYTRKTGRKRGIN